jgi:hypothetical protein
MLRRGGSAAIGLAVLAALVLAVAIPALAAPSNATLPEGFVTWYTPAGPLKVVVGCTAPSGSCSGFLSVSTPDGATNLAGGDYSAPAGGQQTLSMDPGGAETQQLDNLSRR